MADKTEALQPNQPAPEDAPDVGDDLSGRTFGDFQILRRLGQGGMGHVFLARQISLNREVALKFLKPELAANKTSLQRFKKEAEAIGRVAHANIVYIYGIYEVEGRHFMALEYIEGRNLREYMERKRTIDVKTGLAIMGQVASALQRASELGIVHRDIKPENILVTRKDEVKVADFGLSRIFADATQPHLTQSNVTMGTPLYMSPEQVEGKKTIDHRSDIYSFGVTCYHMFVGHPPFRGSSPFEVAIQHVQKEPEPLADIRPDLPSELCAMVHRMIAKDPEARYQTAGEIVRDIGRLRDLLVAMSSGITPSGLILSSSGESFEATASRPIPKVKPTRRSLAVGILLVLICTLLGGGIGLMMRPSPTMPTTENPVPPTKGLIAPLKREQELTKKMEEIKTTGLPEIRGAIEAPIELGLIYLHEKRIEEAEKFFAELENVPPPYAIQFRKLARLGKAMVLAFQDQPKESNDIFIDVMIKPEPKTSESKKVSPRFLQPFWRNHPALREMIALALHHNQQNAPADFPKSLEPYLSPPPPTLK